MHLTLGILRKSQTVSYVFSFFWLDGEAVPASVKPAVNLLACNSVWFMICNCV
jgi:hypothetical protein